VFATVQALSDFRCGFVRETTKGRMPLASWHLDSHDNSPGKEKWVLLGWAPADSMKLSNIQWLTKLRWLIDAFLLSLHCFVIRIWVVILCRRPVPLEVGPCWLFAQRVLPVRANFERRKAITCNHSTSLPVSHLHFQSRWNAMLCHFQIISVSS
jgi:hypothetical protein